ncbi:MAG: hypothetical protein AB2L18_03155 [Anaerolineaceae bacterium]
MGIGQRFLISFSDSLSESFLQPRKINIFIQKESFALIRRIEEKSMEAFSDADKEKIFRICRRLPKLEFILPMPDLQDNIPARISPEELAGWCEEFEDGYVIHKGFLKSRSAEMLLGMLESPSTESVFLAENMERLLRHVEVKREKALCQYSEPLSITKSWEERCTFVVLFCCYANQKKDWRFLNAALKLTGWLWKDYRRPFSNFPTLALLAALVEQEFTLREMQSC